MLPVLFQSQFGLDCDDETAVPTRLGLAYVPTHFSNGAYVTPLPKPAASVNCEAALAKSPSAGAVAFW